MFFYICCRIYFILMNRRGQVRDWENLARITIKEGYFSLNFSGNFFTDLLLGEYYQKYEVPFNLGNAPYGAKVEGLFEENI